eukprot:10093167-Prorocentrum_lima.AAC.1
MQAGAVGRSRAKLAYNSCCLVVSAATNGTQWRNYAGNCGKSCLLLPRPPVGCSCAIAVGGTSILTPQLK